MHIYYLTVSRSHKSGQSLFGSSASWSLSQGLGPESTLSEVQLGKDRLPKLTQLSTGSIQFLTGCWTKDLSSLLAFGQRFLSFPCHVCLPHSILLHQSMQAKKTTEKICLQDGSHTFCNSVTEVTAHHLCHSLFFRTKSLMPAHTHV